MISGIYKIISPFGKIYKGSITRCLKGDLISIRKFKWEYTNG